VQLKKLRWLLVMVLAGLLLGSGCRQPVPVSQPLPRATASYGPWGPVPVSPETVLALVSNLRPSLSSRIAPGQWPLEIKIYGAKVKTVVVWQEMVLVDGRACGDSYTAVLVAGSVGFEFLASVSLPRVLATAKSVRLTQESEPGSVLTLNASGIETLSGAMSNLEFPGSGADGLVPYPRYEVLLTYDSGEARLEWGGRECITLLTPGVLGQISRHDPEERVWQACLALFPPPPHERQTGLRQLFSATKLNVVAGGDSSSRDCTYGGVLSALVTLLLQAEPSSEPAPTDQPSLTATFSYAEHAWVVRLYDNGFTFEGRYYRLESADEAFVRVMNLP
jgi:hypothetical protein